MASAANPADALKQQIEELKASTQPQRDKIAEIEAKAAQEVAEIRASMAETDAAIQRAEFALAALNGEVPLPRTQQAGSSGSRRRARRGSVPEVNVTGEEIVAFLKQAEEPQSASEIRKALNVPEDVPTNKFSVFLSTLVDTEQIGKQGERRATKYVAL